MKTPFPGAVPPRLNPEVVMMVCTAGHVDHGKSSLVHLLTGCQMDRLKEEQERGLTIELGFAPCYLENNLCIGIVDVPGHERLVKTMVAGVSGIAMTILVIAADDGVMPQTVEHVQILDLLGVRRGIVALTKADLVSAERLRSCVEGIRSFLADTFLAGAPVCPVSSRTLDGFPVFHETLAAEIARLVRPSKQGVFRMPVERVFTLPGQGTVVSGIPVDGTIGVGDQVEAVPGGRTGRIRQMQCFLRDAKRGGYGQCLALNIPDFEWRALERGQVLCLAGYLQAADCYHVSLRTVPGLERPLRHAEEIKFHTGTIEETGKLCLLEAEKLGPGEAGFATIVLTKPVAAAAHDRFILRRPSPPATVAGGEICSVNYGPRRPRRMQLLPLLRARSAFFAGVERDSPDGLGKRLEWFLGWERKFGASIEEISRATLLSVEVATEVLKRLVISGRVRVLGADFFILTEAYRACREQLEAKIHRAGENGELLALDLNEWQRDLDLPLPLWKHLEQDLAQTNRIHRRRGQVTVAGAEDNLPLEDRRLLDELIQLYEESGYHSPRPDELPDRLKARPERVQLLLSHLCSEQKLVRLSPHVVLSYKHFKTAQDLVVKLVTEKGVLNSADFKYWLSSTRKYALAILDYLDARRVTVRTGNDRKLASGYEKNLI